MICGIGLDIVGVDRIRGVLDRRGRRFVDLVCTPTEAAYVLAAADPAERLAVRWAAKEACGKALGVGLLGGQLLRSVTVVHDRRGAPRLQLEGPAAAAASALGARNAHLSLTHADGMAAAVVILES